MQFQLTIKYSIYTYTFRVERTAADRSFERYRLTAGDRVVMLQCNRPMLLARGLKKKPITWKVREGEVKDEKALAKVYQAIENYLKAASPEVNPIRPAKLPDLPARVLMHQTNMRKKGGGGGPTLEQRAK
ncbi:hypothetical protein SAMN05444008_101102 [Cnuella takakiae]|uniref:Uncharacterized protein n=1 Tax=Cnuella takakiae TaxID=1302690 RepID=A0A1M4SEY1_9BACT|nr:hypothetical protein [Cnuella takakiae]OLY94486.1 hypothetical protein BUE76_23370 [Cnuella takakiae]SHE30741.1 hypothetical protein SAMN05444008_101102 [Cnuella takakiae]